ncbi:Kyphoscoliosis peptidase [Escovopsis weberi]|uniref:Kyphoscoliosis peptidase n=1 Tax=Escovopsis weberi TaxID=150374 RepID=A0A0M9VSB0_ESCWE|nr:Kyphoscoliosis peptidase [Escovopsis weberi]
MSAGESLPTNDPIGYLARGLCDRFPSYTDKARAIFTWFHHNISYDTVAFFGNSVGRQTPERTISTGLAVCAGYAETYNAIAVRAGLECVVVVGHGKGFGHNALRKGERPPPPKPEGHAWNAVRIDGGEWKLIDACWGAGHICTTANLFKREFHPAQFAAPNDVFARKHFPADPRHQFRNDGRVMSWEEYYVGPTDGVPVEVYGETEQEGIAEDSIQPRERHISANRGQAVRFQFSKVCEHWTSEGSGLGPPPLLLLLVQRPDGSVGDMLPMETDGFWHWLDVDAGDLGGPGRCVFVAKLISFGDREGKAARGVSKEEFVAKRGRIGMAWSTMMKWEVQ